MNESTSAISDRCAAGLEELGQLLWLETARGPLSQTAWTALRYMATERDPQARTLTGFCSTWGQTKGSVGRVLRHLTALGLLETRSGRTDAGTAIIILDVTEAGRAMLARSPTRALSATISATLTPQEQELLLDLILRLFLELLDARRPATVT